MTSVVDSTRAAARSTSANVTGPATLANDGARTADAASAGEPGKPQAFDLIIEGVAYLNRVRTIKPNKGPTYEACTLNAMMGTADAVEYVSIDCRIVGRQALEAVGRLKTDVLAKRRVIVGFRAGDPKPDFYEYPDRTTGEPRNGQGLKARLLQLTFAKVDGQRIEIPLVQRAGDAPTAGSTEPAAQAEATHA